MGLFSVESRLSKIRSGKEAVFSDEELLSLVYDHEKAKRDLSFDEWNKISEVVSQYSKRDKVKHTPESFSKRVCDILAALIKISAVEAFSNNEQRSFCLTMLEKLDITVYKRRRACYYPLSNCKLFYHYNNFDIYLCYRKNKAYLIRHDNSASTNIFIGTVDSDPDYRNIAGYSNRILFIGKDDGRYYLYEYYIDTMKASSVDCFDSDQGDSFTYKEVLGSYTVNNKLVFAIRNTNSSSAEQKVWYLAYYEEDKKFWFHQYSADTIEFQYFRDNSSALACSIKATKLPAGTCRIKCNEFCPLRTYLDAKDNPKLAERIEQLKYTIKLIPEHDDAAELLGKLGMENGFYRAASIGYDNLLKTYPNNKRIMIRLAESLLKTGEKPRIKRSLEICEQYKQHFQDNVLDEIAAIAKMRLEQPKTYSVYIDGPKDVRTIIASCLLDAIKMDLVAPFDKKIPTIPNLVNWLPEFYQIMSARGHYLTSNTEDNGVMFFYAGYSSSFAYRNNEYTEYVYKEPSKDDFMKSFFSTFSSRSDIEEFVDWYQAYKERQYLRIKIPATEENMSSLAKDVFNHAKGMLEDEEKAQHLAYKAMYMLGIAGDLGLRDYSKSMVQYIKLPIVRNKLDYDMQEILNYVVSEIIKSKKSAETMNKSESDAEVQSNNQDDNNDHDVETSIEEHSGEKDISTDIQFRTCPECGRQSAPGTVVCPYCGTGFQTETPETEFEEDNKHSQVEDQKLQPDEKPEEQSDEIAPDSNPDKEKYGEAWISLAKGDKNSFMASMKELDEAGFIEGSIALAMFTQNQSERKSLLKKAADAGNPEGMWEYCGFLQHSYCPDPAIPADAIWEKYCLAAAEAGSVDAMNEMGNVFHRRKHYAESMYWYALANANDHGDAKMSMRGIAREWAAAGCPREFSAGSPKYDEKRHAGAIAYLELNAGQSLSTPLDKLFILAVDGIPIVGYFVGDLSEAANKDELACKVYSALANVNDPHGMKCYADMLMSGKGVELNTEKAIQYYRTAAEKGERSAMFITGEFTKQQSKEMAAYWYGISHTRGYEYSSQRLTQLAK